MGFGLDVSACEYSSDVQDMSKGCVGQVHTKECLPDTSIGRILRTTSIHLYFRACTALVHSTLR